MGKNVTVQSNRGFVVIVSQTSVIITSTEKRHLSSGQGSAAAISHRPNRWTFFVNVSSYHQDQHLAMPITTTLTSNPWDPQTTISTLQMVLRELRGHKYVNSGQQVIDQLAGKCQGRLWDRVPSTDSGRCTLSISRWDRKLLLSKQIWFFCY